MAALFLDERCVILARQIFFVQIKTHQATSEASAATYNVMEPHYHHYELLIAFCEGDIEISMVRENPN